MQDFRKLKVWEKAHTLALSIYRVTESFPKSEVFGLTSQMRRSAASVPSNIAEGCGRNTNGDLLRTLDIAMGSARELEYQLLLSRELDFLSEEQHSQLAADVAEVDALRSHHEAAFTVTESGLFPLRTTNYKLPTT